MSSPVQHDDVEACVDAVLEQVGPSIRLALPLGIGKPIRFANALYRRAEADPSLSLEIYTGLTLSRPIPSASLERRLLEPMADRLFGDSPPLAYAEALARNALPENVSVREFFFQPGLRLGQTRAQQDYISSNYTHVARDTAERGINVIGQLVSPRKDGRYSLSCNPDVTLDILPLVRTRTDKPVVVGEVNANLPFMGGNAALSADMFQHMLTPAGEAYEPFTVPHQPVSATTYAAALFASTLIRDGGTLQVGIGAFSDALIAALLLRHRDPAKYRRVLADLGYRDPDGLPGAFEQGLYAASEMFVDGFVDLMAAGILSRRVYDHPALQLLANHGRLPDAPDADALERLYATNLLPAVPDAKDVATLKRHGILSEDIVLRYGHFELPGRKRVSARFDTPDARAKIAKACLGPGLKGGCVVHSGFFVGSQGFREKLRGLPEADRARIGMTGIHFVNQLYGDETLKRLQRRDAVFINNAMMVTLMGAAVSDGLEDGRVVSGVGGQYNFVAMAHALEDARSVIYVPAVREKDGERRSNIVSSYGHTTVPRHLRDIVVTEYGIADLRGRTDAECIEAMLSVTDTDFQDELLDTARKAGKVPDGLRLPEAARGNRADRIEAAIDRHRTDGDFTPYPLGTEMTGVEQALADALQALKRRGGTTLGKLGVVLDALVKGGAKDAHSPYLERMDLSTPRRLKDRFERRLVVAALKARGVG